MVISPEHFLNELLGYQKTAALKAAIELDLFSALAAAGGDLGEVSERTGASERGIRIRRSVRLIQGKCFTSLIAACGAGANAPPIDSNPETGAADFPSHNLARRDDPTGRESGARHALIPVERSHLFLQPRAEGPHVRRLSPLLRANERVATARRQGQIEGHDETPLAQIVEGERIEREQHAGAFDRRVESVICAIESKATTDVGVPYAGRRKPVSPVRHDGATGQTVVMD
jgi:hypothetical protein